ncbi:MAG: class I SAM-dependent methyltransferase [Kiloniellales bacterium]
MRSAAYEQARLRKVAALAEGQSVLDIGYAQIPNPYLEGHHRVGFDLNSPSEGAVRYEEELRGDVCDITKVLQGRTFDTIICGELIEHLENPYAFLRDVRCLLKPAGRLILTTPNPLGFPVLLCELLRLRRYFYTTEHLYYFLPRWVMRMLEHTGYRVAAVKPVGWWLPFGVLGLCPVQFSYQVIYVAQNLPMTADT